MSGVLDISTLYKLIHGGAYPHHNISTVDLTSERIKKILDQNPPAGVSAVEIANKVKVGIMMFAKSPSGTSPFEIIGAQPQTNNATSDFTRDLVEASRTVAKTFNASFLNFAVDGVSLEQTDVMTEICNFLSGDDNHIGSVDNKHRIKNDRYQVIGRQALVSVGIWVCD